MSNAGKGRARSSKKAGRDDIDTVPGGFTYKSHLIGLVGPLCRVWFDRNRVRQVAATMGRLFAVVGSRAPSVIGLHTHLRLHSLQDTSSSWLGSPWQRDMQLGGAWIFFFGLLLSRGCISAEWAWTDMVLRHHPTNSYLQALRPDLGCRGTGLLVLGFPSGLLSLHGCWHPTTEQVQDTLPGSISLRKGRKKKDLFRDGKCSDEKREI